MRNTVRLLAALVAVLGLQWVAVTSSWAESNDDRITDYQVAATVDSHGKTDVLLTLTVDYGDTPGHGPFLAFPLHQDTEDGRWRMYDYTVGAISSPSGADATTQTSESDGNLIIRVGSESRTFTGDQTYRINYSVVGLVAPNQKDSGLDEFNWSVVGLGWQVPIDKVSVELTGPADITRTACVSDGDMCPHSSREESATYATGGVGDGRAVKVVAGFPVGTFSGVATRYTEPMTLGRALTADPWTVTTAALVAGGGLFLLYRRLRRSARDEVYLGLTPGLTPAGSETGTVGRGGADGPIAVAFQPPRDTRPGEIGTLIDATVDDRDITATMVDLAVRGHLTIEQSGKKDFTFTLKQSSDELADYESTLLSKLFRSSGQVTTDDLRDESYSDLMSDTRSALYSRITHELGWYARSPQYARVAAVLGGAILVAGGIGLAWLLGQYRWGLVGLGVVVVGIAVLIMNNKFGRRTATGSAVLAQAKGFELYLTTAEAEQIKFEEGIDVFSRYLPFAMVFGVADRWTKIFQQLAADGRYEFSPYWYFGSGYGFGGLGASDFAHSLDSLGSSVSSSIQAATAASSGGSGFSSMGGGGGGFGGGGGGTW